ncbi:hypothetical protein BDZ94DRAFT_1239316 [Collybia nuda]|uniref:Uncharacterized protein n=1 Tax=Collybia nuda TaxID=64659 RepID=A0A9P5Y0V5_9AGAR|nr:hypothetical protein BDZ94DRAFT_1239316 [Collybia nuda]
MTLCLQDALKGQNDHWMQLRSSLTCSIKIQSYLEVLKHITKRSKKNEDVEYWCKRQTVIGMYDEVSPDELSSRAISCILSLPLALVFPTRETFRHIVNPPKCFVHRIPPKLPFPHSIARTRIRSGAVNAENKINKQIGVVHLAQIEGSRRVNVGKLMCQTSHNRRNQDRQSSNKNGGGLGLDGIQLGNRDFAVRKSVKSRDEAKKVLRVNSDSHPNTRDVRIS